MIGYRKLIVTMLGIASADLALWLGKVEGVAWATMVSAMVAGFLALNAVTKKAST